jgi:hypothetical protein
MYEPKVTDEMIFSLILVHRDLFRLISPYARPGFLISFQMRPIESRARPFICKIEKHAMVGDEVVQQWAVVGEGDTAEGAAEEAAKSARLHPS